MENGPSYHKCRLCLKLGNFLSIFEEDEAVKISEMAMTIADIKISEGDNLPDRICNSCLENVSAAYIFKSQCEKIDAHLHSYLDASKVSSIDSKIFFDCKSLLNQELYIHSNIEATEQNKNNRCIAGSTSESSSTPTSSDYTSESDCDRHSVKCVICNEQHKSFYAHYCGRIEASVEPQQTIAKIEKEVEHSDIDITDPGKGSGSDETLVADDVAQVNFNLEQEMAMFTSKVSCVLCDEKFDKYNDYSHHINICTANVKLHYFVCPVCQKIHSEKNVFLQHLKTEHFKLNSGNEIEPYQGIDCVDHIGELQPIHREYGWSLEGINKEPIYSYVGQKEPIYSSVNKRRKESFQTSSPVKTFLGKLGLEKQSTPKKKISFRKIFQEGKQMTSNYMPFRRYVDNYKSKRKSFKDTSGQLSDILEDVDKPLIEQSEVIYGIPNPIAKKLQFQLDDRPCTCKKIFMISEFLENREKLATMILELGGVVADDTKTEILATHFVATLPRDACTGMMVCALATGKWLLDHTYVTDSHQGMKFLNEQQYEWSRQPKMLDLSPTSVAIAKAGTFWRHQVRVAQAPFPFEGASCVLIMRKKYRQYYQMVFRSLKAKIIPYDVRNLEACAAADYCFVDMRVIERINLKFFADHEVPVFPYQYVLIYLLHKGHVKDEDQFLLQGRRKCAPELNKTF